MSVYFSDGKDIRKFLWSTDDWPRFCGGGILHEFRSTLIGVIERREWNKNGGPNAVEKKDLLEAIIKEEISIEQTAVFIFADVKGGEADRYLFSNIPDKPFSIETLHHDLAITPVLSPYFLNPNSGNMCRILTVFISGWEE